MLFRHAGRHVRAVQDAIPEVLDIVAADAQGIARRARGCLVELKQVRKFDAEFPCKGQRFLRGQQARKRKDKHEYGGCSIQGAPAISYRRTIPHDP